MGLVPSKKSKKEGRKGGKQGGKGGGNLNLEKGQGLSSECKNQIETASKKENIDSNQKKNLYRHVFNKLLI